MASSSSLKQLSTLLPFLYGLRWRYAIGAFLLLVTNGAALLIPWLLKLAVEQLEQPVVGGHTAGEYGIMIALLAVAYALVRIFSRTVILHGARHLEYRIREALFARLMLLDQSFYSKERTGDILSRFSNDLLNVRMLAGFGAMSLMNTAIIYVAAIWLMLKTSPILTFAAVMPLPLMILVVQAVSTRIFVLSRQTQEELGNLSSHAEEAFSAVRLIKSYCREEQFGRRFSAAADRCLAKNLELARLRGFVIPVMALATGFGTLAVLYLGGRQVIQGSMTLGDFVAFSGYLALLVWPTMVLGWIITLFQRGSASMARMNDLLNTQPAVSEIETPIHQQEPSGAIEFRKLCFLYDNRPVLDQLSFAVRPGERIGITGPVGSGKSTLLQIIPRLLPVADGMLFMDGHDINSLSLDQLRRLIGYMPQEATLFSRSIEENIAYGGSGESLKAAYSAGLQADLAGFENGLNTRIGERGVMLSGGQRQRVALARALVRESCLLLLDDPLSAVDADNEEEILTQLSKAWQGKTVLMVSHRLSAFRHVDRVLVLEKGRIVEEGPPDELIRLGGLYAELAERQGSSKG